MNNVTPIKPPAAPQLTTSQASAVLEVQRQLHQASVLVSAAKHAALEGWGGEPEEGMAGISATLLDMAEDILGDLEYINRLVKAANGEATNE